MTNAAVINHWRKKAVGLSLTRKEAQALAEEMGVAGTKEVKEILPLFREAPPPDYLSGEQQYLTEENTGFRKGGFPLFK